MGSDATLYRLESSIENKRYLLHTLANWQNGYAFKGQDVTADGLPIIKIAELNNGLTASTTYSNNAYPDKVHVYSGDYLFSWSGNPRTSIDIFRLKIDEGWLNQHIFVVKPDETVIDRDFFFYLMKWLKPTFIAIASNKQTTGLGHVTKADLKSISVPLPMRTTQAAIAKLLRRFDDLIAINERTNDYLSA